MVVGLVCMVVPYHRVAHIYIFSSIYVCGYPLSQFFFTFSLLVVCVHPQLPSHDNHIIKSYQPLPSPSPAPMKNFNDNHSDTDEEPPLLVVLEETNEDSVPTNSDTTTTTTSPRPPCPVTILAGFLGAGKSTLVNYILKSPDHGKRIAVIENEFGDGLDVEAIIAKDGASNQSLTEFIELPNGCVCCTVKDSLVTTLEILLEKRAELDYIIIECRCVSTYVMVPVPYHAYHYSHSLIFRLHQWNGQSRSHCFSVLAG